MNKYYHPPQASNWTGRPTRPELGTQYWYQAIELVDHTNPESVFMSESKPEVALVGYACDEGVRRNLGRPGAKEGPGMIRQRLAKLAWHHSKRVADWGDVRCDIEDMEGCQEQLAGMIHQLITNGVFPIVLGGGHDVAYGHFKGIRESVKGRIGIINFDAHFDLRPVENRPNSGTPFNQILTEWGVSVDYLAIGIQNPSNTPDLFAIANDFGVQYILQEDCTSSHLEQQLALFVEKNDYLYITIDLDGFSSAFAPGVSAPSPMGLTPEVVVKALRFLLSTRKVISCDIAELNPRYDQDQATANLAARLVDVLASRPIAGNTP